MARRSGVAVTKSARSELAALGVHNNDDLKALWDRKPELLLPLLLRRWFDEEPGLDPVLTVSVFKALLQQSPEKLATPFMLRWLEREIMSETKASFSILMIAARGQLRALYDDMVHRERSKSGGSTPKPTPAWVARAMPAIEKAKAKNPDIGAWAMAGAIVREVDGAPEQQAVFKYIKKHNFLTKL
jgi:hypothetical protein